jgi:hypothetical protein
MTAKISYQTLTCHRYVKHFFLLVLSVFLLGACEKEPETGNLFISTEYQGAPEDNVECWLYESFYKFTRYEFLQKELSDEYGEVYFDNLEPGWYFVEARKVKSSLFTIYAADSVEVQAGRRTNKILVMFQLE